MKVQRFSLGLLSQHEISLLNQVRARDDLNLF
uniref:Uncharacterized protein n=1 Tax=Rhizophora mucronata TaxID=61149 RepID=A0A2P2N2J5_RHIMU